MDYIHTLLVMEDDLDAEGTEDAEPAEEINEANETNLANGATKTLERQQAMFILAQQGVLQLLGGVYVAGAGQCHKKLRTNVVGKELASVQQHVSTNYV